jgi:hypothetical protein
MLPLNVILVPVPVGSGGIGWERRCPPPKYPRNNHPSGWPPAQPIPTQSARDMLAEAKRVIAQAREQKALPELNP